MIKNFLLPLGITIVLTCALTYYLTYEPPIDGIIINKMWKGPHGEETIFPYPHVVQVPNTYFLIIKTKKDKIEMLQVTKEEYDSVTFKDRFIEGKGKQ
jgi:hypothetical protein